MKQLKYHLLQKNSICRVLRTVECILISAFLCRLGPVTCRILRNLFVPIPLYFQKLQIKLLRIFSKSMKKGKSVKTTRNYRFKYYYQGTNERIVIREIPAIPKWKSFANRETNTKLFLAVTVKIDFNMRIAFLWK